MPKLKAGTEVLEVWEGDYCYLVPTKSRIGKALLTAIERVVGDLDTDQASEVRISRYSLGADFTLIED